MSVTPADLEALATNPAAMTGDEGSVTERSADDVLKLAAAAAADTALTGDNPQGGRKSAWRLTRKAIFSPGGGH